MRALRQFVVFRWRVKDKESPCAICNWTLYMSVLVFGIFGAAWGLDEGNVSGNLTQVSFSNQFGLTNPSKSEQEIVLFKSNIASMVQIGSVAGAMIAMYTVDKLGRTNALRAVCTSVGQLFAGRFLEGFSIGQTTIIGPTYLAEVSPRAIRGMCTCIFAGAIYIGVSISYLAKYGTALHVSNASRAQWAIPLSMKLVMAALILGLSFVFYVESPRRLLKVNRPKDAITALCKLRKLPTDHPYIVSEISDINESLMSEKQATAQRSKLGMLKELFCSRANLHRFFVIAAGVQLLGHCSGANAITVYASELFKVVGVTGSGRLKMTAFLGLVKLCSAYPSAFVVIDFLGRRLALYLVGSDRNASKGALAALFLSGTAWIIGFNYFQHLSFAQSAVMVLHFANQYGNSKVLQSIMRAKSAFFFFVGVLLVSLFWALFFSMEEIFNLPWYIIGRNGAELCPD
ncbi:MFS general substrate transporter [Metschnikowia bicuspidata]|uniref:MFS general substrate transporter n=1 Tax=Metschnikowia bicuspidata TaxID=27322 RepID=A0A4P9ZEZ3_9ASCO|nr:MFS general substrate transporter [Metschnikowia bicuspidata]